MADRAFTDLELERLIADDLPAARVAEIEAKATTADRARLDELRADNQAFLAQVDVAAEVRAIGRRMEKLAPEPSKLATWWRWIFAGGALAAAAAAILLIVRRDDKPTEDDLGIKGTDVALIVHTEHRQLASGDTVQAGDKIRFEINAGRRGYVAVVGVDGTNTTSVYFPARDQAPGLIDPKVDRMVPGAIVLDDTPGDEKFFALYSEQPFSLEAALPAVKGGAPPVGVVIAEVVLHKRLN